MYSHSLQHKKQTLINKLKLSLETQRGLNYHKDAIMKKYLLNSAFIIVGLLVRGSS
jgi:hypothetical protein